MSSSERLSSLSINSEGFVFEPSTGDSYVLNQSALVIVQGLQDGIDESQIAAELCSQFDVTDAEACRDVSDFISRLKSFDLV